MSNVVALRQPSKQILQRMTLIGCWLDADFRYGDAGLHDKLYAKGMPDPEPGEVILFVSCERTQLLWLLGFSDHGGKTVLDTRRWRICSGGRWDRYMLQNYAHEVGIELVNIPAFEEEFELMQQRKRLGITRAQQKRNANVHKALYDAIKADNAQREKRQKEAAKKRKKKG